MSDVNLKDLLPGPFLTVRPGDQVVVFLKRTVTPEVHRDLDQVLPADVDWVFIGDSPFAGVVHVARGDKEAPEGYVKLKDRLSLTSIKTVA